MQLSFDEMMKLAESKEELRAKREVVDGVPVIIFNYMVAMTNTFDSELAREFRGTTFREDTKELISRPFPKFFNVGERADTQFDRIEWNNARYYTKFDGSLAIPVSINGWIHWKTKKSFFSDVAKQIQDFWHRNNHMTHPEMGKGFTEAVLISACEHFTPLFEYVSPNNRIVLEYPEERLNYLGFRNNLTGEFTPYAKTECFNVPREVVRDLPGIEGFVIHDGKQLVKMKTQWYLDRHNLCTEFNPKKIIQTSLDGTIDDIIACIYQLGLHDRAKQVEKLRDEVQTYLISCKGIIEQSFHDVQKYSNNRKLFAEQVQKIVQPTYRSFMFLLLDGKDYTSNLHKHVFDGIYGRYKETL